MVLLAEYLGESSEGGLMRHLPHKTLPRDSDVLRRFCVWDPIPHLASPLLLDDADPSRRRREKKRETPSCCSANGNLGPRLSIEQLQANRFQAPSKVRRMVFFVCTGRSRIRGGGDHRMHQKRQANVPFQTGYLHRVRVLVLASGPAFETKACFIRSV